MNASPTDSAGLSAAQRAALAFAERTAKSHEADARERVDRVLRHSGCGQDDLVRAMHSVRDHGRIVVHFHPDRYGTEPLTVAESLVEDGRYRNQFETGLSAGSRSAFPGGSRDRWERDLFGGAYHRPEVPPNERPKYGALELVRHPDGPIPRFGSCYFVLRQAVATRATFTFSGSEKPNAVDRLGTSDNLFPVMAPLLEEVARGGATPVAWPPFSAPTLGVRWLSVGELLERLGRDLPVDRPDPSVGPAGRVLDSGVEAHVHGDIDLRRDVELLVMDPSFRGTSTSTALDELCRRYGIPGRWHCGFQLSVDAVPDDFRGPMMQPLARRIAPAGWIDAAVIGAAEASVSQRPQDWEDWGPPAETLQHLKQLWHVLVHYGAPAMRQR